MTPTLRQSMRVSVREKTWSPTGSTFYWAEGSDESEGKQQREKRREEAEEKETLNGEQRNTSRVAEGADVTFNRLKEKAESGDEYQVSSRCSRRGGQGGLHHSPPRHRAFIPPVRKNLHFRRGHIDFPKDRVHFRSPWRPNSRPTKW